MQTTRWMVRTADRVGMALDVLQVISGAGINILAMEVSAHHIFIKFAADAGLAESLRQAVLRVRGVRAVEQAPELLTALTRGTGVTFDDIVHRSPAMARLIAMARQAARTDATVLLVGESGTGKDLLARAIHAASPRAGARCVPVNCAALPETLIESELFGYEAGAFTGARPGGRQGMFEYAHRGTLFMDEVAELPLHLQAKLLRVLQDGQMRRVGGRAELVVDVRIIAATNRDLAALVRERQFREDLYYRLSVIPLVIPPLRERPEDLDLLVDYLLEKWSQRIGQPQPELTPAARRAIREYPWPGNVRELENVLERAITLAEGPAIGPEHLMLGPRAAPAPGPGVPAAAGPGGAGLPPAAPAGTGLPSAAPAGGGRTSGGVPSGGGPTLRELVAEREREALVRALAEHRSIRQAARALGVSHTALINKLRRHGLRGPELR